MNHLRPSPALVIALVALFAALGGTAIGAKLLSKKQVTKIARAQANKVFDQRKAELQPAPISFYARRGEQAPGCETSDCVTGSFVSCDSGDVAVGGGFWVRFAPTFGSTRVIQSTPLVDRNTAPLNPPPGWFAQWTGPTSGEGRAMVICAHQG
jgi:hypothetical protein